MTGSTRAAYWRGQKVPADQNDMTRPAQPASRRRRLTGKRAWLGVLAGRVVTVALCAGLICGCQQPAGQGQAGARLRPVAYPYVEDIPVPEGFVRVDGPSVSDSFGQGRYIEHYYRGKASRLQVRDFYLEQMPQKGWKLLVNREAMEGVYILCFRKGSEPCRIDIRRVPSGLGYQTQVRVLVMSTGPSRPAEGPSPKPATSTAGQP